MKQNLAARSVLALVLMIVFYALGAAAVALLVALGYWAFLLLVSIGVNKLALVVAIGGAACFAAAAVIAWSMLPRVDRFEPPGPELLAEEQPALFEEIRAIGEATGEALPSHVYLVADVNAFVTQRGGFMGIGSQRVMGLGLPLMAILNVSQLRAVLAHEFGHFYGGDTRLGPWIYKTRGAVSRTIVNLSRSVESTTDEDAGLLAVIPFIFNLVQQPFLMFGNLFMRITQAISRAQEYSADALAARTMGPASLASGLKAVSSGALAYEAYFRGELVPVLEGGCRVPIVDGFHSFLGVGTTTEQLADALARELAEGAEDQYDSHPPLRERVKALEAFESSAAEAAIDERPAVELLVERASTEARLLAFMTDGSELRAIDWSEAIEEVYEPRWRESAEHAREMVVGLTPATLPREPDAIRDAIRREIGDDADFIEQESLMRVAIERYGAALSVALLDAGFAPIADMGAPFRFVRGEQSVEPWNVVSQYVTEEIDEAEWIGTWTKLEIADKVLAEAPTTSAPTDADDLPG